MGELERKNQDYLYESMRRIVDEVVSEYFDITLLKHLDIKLPEQLDIKLPEHLDKKLPEIEEQIRYSQWAHVVGENALLKQKLEEANENEKSFQKQKQGLEQDLEKQKQDSEKQKQDLKNDMRQLERQLEDMQNRLEESEETNQKLQEKLDMEKHKQSEYYRACEEPFRYYFPFIDTSSYEAYVISISIRNNIENIYKRMRRAYEDNDMEGVKIGSQFIDDVIEVSKRVNGMGDLKRQKTESGMTYEAARFDRVPGSSENGYIREIVYKGLEKNGNLVGKSLVEVRANDF